MKEAIVPFIFFKRGHLSDLGPITHMGPSTVNKPISTGCVTITVAVGLEFLLRFVRAQSSVFQLEMPLHSSPEAPLLRHND